jgi:hypothetical protein
MSESQMQILWQKKQTIDLGRVGHLSGLHPSLTSLDLRTLHDTMSAFAVAQAMLQGIGGGQTETAITVRQIVPNLDLTAGDNGSTVDLPIASAQWRQPSLVATSLFYAANTGADDANYDSVYTTSKNAKNDQKIIIMYGLRAVGVGNIHSGTVVKSVQWQFWRKGTKLIDRWYVEQLNSAPENFVAAVTPVMFKKDDSGEVRVFPDSATLVDANKFDRLQVLGVVAESLGVNTMG